MNHLQTLSKIARTINIFMSAAWRQSEQFITMTQFGIITQSNQMKQVQETNTYPYLQSNRTISGKSFFF